MLLTGPGTDVLGRRWVEAQLPPGHLAVSPPGVFVCDGAGGLLTHLGYREPPERWLEALGALVGAPARRFRDERPELAACERRLREGRLDGVRERLASWLAQRPDDQGGAAWAKLLLGVEAYRTGDMSRAHAWWDRVLTEHGDHPLSHRARYHLYDAETWPTRLHEDLAGAARPRTGATPARNSRVENSRAEGLRTENSRGGNSRIESSSPQDSREPADHGRLEMVSVPPGTFTMGGSPALLSRELPTHRVTLTRGFAMSATTITRAQWAAFTGAEVVDHGSAPQVGISYGDALAYCAWLSQRESATYRLPTEAEWEWAARGGLEGAQYPWGDAPISPQRCNYLGPRPVAVRSYPPNGYGLYEMVGNVQEWTSDLYRERAYGERAGAPVVDPTGPPSADRDLPLRVVRGGQCGASVIQLFCRNSFRLGLFEEYSGGSIGLRVVREES